jgi:hypothetical protein
MAPMFDPATSKTRSNARAFVKLANLDDLGLALRRKCTADSAQAIRAAEGSDPSRLFINHTDLQSRNG